MKHNLIFINDSKIKHMKIKDLYIPCIKSRQKKETLKRIALDTNLAKIFEFDQVLGLAFLHLDKPLKLLHEIK